MEMKVCQVILNNIKILKLIELEKITETLRVPQKGESLILGKIIIILKNIENHAYKIKNLEIF